MNDEIDLKNELSLLGDNIRNIRIDRGLSQEVLGFKADLHRNYISSLERALKNPTYTTLLKIAIALDIELVDLISYNKKQHE